MHIVKIAELSDVLKIPLCYKSRTASFAICQLYSRAFRFQQNNHRMCGRKANSVNSSSDSLTSLSSTGAHGKVYWNETTFGKSIPNKRPHNLEKELETLARELLPRVLKMPFTVEQWIAAVNSVCDQDVIKSWNNANSDNCNETKRFSCLERPKLPMIGLASMEKRLSDPKAKHHSRETLQPTPREAITLRVPDPINFRIIWVPRLHPQTTQLLQSYYIHRNCQQSSEKVPRGKYCSSRQKVPLKKISIEPEHKPKPKAKARRKRPCCCCCRVTRQELECSGSAPAIGRSSRSPSKAASAPSPAKLQPIQQAKPIPKPKTKPKPKAKPAPTVKEETEKIAAPPKGEQPKVEIKVEKQKPAAKPSKTGSESSSDDSSGSETPPAGPAVPGPATDKYFMADLFASSPAGGGSYAPSGASSPKPAAGADWMTEFGRTGTSSPKPPASPGADWLTGGASQATPAAGSDWLTGSAQKSASPGADWLS